MRDSGSRSWVQRLMVHGRRVDIGLGNAELVSLADARRARTISFAQAEPRALAEKAETWRAGADSQSLRDWRSTMAAYVLPAAVGATDSVRPRIRARPVSTTMQDSSIHNSPRINSGEPA